MEHSWHQNVESELKIRYFLANNKYFVTYSFLGNSPASEI